MSLTALLDAIENPHPALIFVDRREREQRLPWTTLATEARQVGVRLLEHGVQIGDRVGLVFRTQPDFFRAFFGCLYAGAVPTPLYPPVRLGRLDAYHQRTAQMLQDAGASLVLWRTKNSSSAAKGTAPMGGDV